jgi:iron-sulfur cluster repair protein YtfE (RIC family)
MSSIPSVSNIIAKLSGEHKIITDYVVKYNEKLKQKDEEFFNTLNEFLDFLKQDLLKHFEIEELVFFPAAILGAPSYETTLMVMSLQKEHGSLEKQLQLLIKELKDSGVTRDRFNDMGQELFKNFFEQLKIHAKRELIELFPMIDENPRSRSLIKSFAEELKKGSSGLR